MAKTVEENLKDATNAHQEYTAFVEKAVSETRFGEDVASDGLTGNVVLTGKIRRNIPKSGKGKGK